MCSQLFIYQLLPSQFGAEVQCHQAKPGGASCPLSSLDSRASRRFRSPRSPRRRTRGFLKAGLGSIPKESKSSDHFLGTSIKATNDAKNFQTLCDVRVNGLRLRSTLIRVGNLNLLVFSCSKRVQGCTNTDRASVAPQQHQALEELQEPPRISPLWTCSKRRGLALSFLSRKTIHSPISAMPEQGRHLEQRSLASGFPNLPLLNLPRARNSRNIKQLWNLMISTRYIVNQDILLHECQAPPLEVVGPSASRESPSPMVHLAMLRKRHIPWHRSHSLPDWHVRCVRPMEQR